MAQDDESPKKPLTGRPPIAPEDRRKALIKVLATKAEHEEFRQLADAAHMTVSSWVRIAALEKVALEKARRGTGGSPVPDVEQDR
jgi:hypothetical protein